MRFKIHFAVTVFAAIFPAFPSSGATPAEEARQKIGVYAWGALPRAKPGEWVLVAAAEKAKALGAEVLRTEISPCYWDPEGSPTRLPLDQLVLRPDYDAVLDMFPMVILTAYDLASCDETSGSPQYRAAALSPETLRAVHEEWWRFVFAVATRHPGTKVVFSNWEGENDAIDQQWPGYLDYIRARLFAARDARDAAKQWGYPGEVYSAFEFIHLKTGYQSPWPLADGTLPPPRTVSGLVSAFDLRDDAGNFLWDFLSYSSWDSIAHTEDRSRNPRTFREAFQTIRDACAEAGGDCAQHIIIGEVGYLRNYDDESSSALADIFRVCLEENAQYVVNWVLADQPGQVDSYGFGVDESKFGKFTVDGELTPQGVALADWYRNGIQPQ